ncbi:MAG: hypothetical protein ACT4O9_12250, partial [Blastocatellia bacterium]
GNSSPPEKVFMAFWILSAANQLTSTSKATRLVRPFKSGSEAEVSIEISSVHEKVINRQDNFYTFVEFSSDGKFVSLPHERTAQAEMTSVVFVHGERSKLNR